MIEHASTVVSLPLALVEAQLWDVPAWPTFVGDVVWVSRIAHERYLFGVRQGRRVRDVPAAVRWHPRDHRVTWQELEGPPWQGEIRLAELGGRRTMVTMRVRRQGSGVVRALPEVLVAHRRRLDLDLRRFADRMASLPHQRSGDPADRPQAQGGRPVA